MKNYSQIASRAWGKQELIAYGRGVKPFNSTDIHLKPRQIGWISSRQVNMKTLVFLNKQRSSGYNKMFSRWSLLRVTHVLPPSMISLWHCSLQGSTQPSNILHASARGHRPPWSLSHLCYSQLKIQGLCIYNLIPQLAGRPLADHDKWNKNTW